MNCMQSTPPRRPWAWRAKLSCLTALMGLAAATTGSAQAQPAAPYPTKPIRVVVPFPPGGGGDVLARLVLSRVGRELGQTMIFDNVAGAGGNIGVAGAVRAPADGYTLVYGTSGTHAINQTLYKSPGFNAEKDFAPVSQLTRIAAMVVVRPDFPARSMPELLALLRAHPGKYTFGSAGNGTTSHLAGEMLKTAAGLQAVHVPYRGGALAMTDLLGGQIDFLVDVMPNTMPQVNGGKLRALAVTTSTRVASVPNLPTVAESGVPGFEVGAWDALFAPASTPPAIIDTLNAAVRKALADPDLRRMLVERGAEPAPSSPVELRNLVHTETLRWGAAVKASGATTD